MTVPQYRSLLSFLLAFADPRPGTPQYRWDLLLKLLLAGLVSGHGSPSELARWASLRCLRLQQLLGLRDERMPSERTFGRVLDALCPLRTEEQIRQHNGQSGCDGERPATWRGRDGVLRRLLSVDGKVVRGASSYGRKVWLLSLTDPGSGQVLRQLRVETGRNEIPTAPVLLAGYDLRGCVVAMDAGLAHRDLAQQIVDQGGDYLMVIKGNQPETQAGIAALFAVPSSPCFDPERERTTQTERSHGRMVERFFESSELVAGTVCWPGCRQVARRCNRAYLLRKRRWRKIRWTYLLTSLPATIAGPKQLLLLARGHWGIENRLHWRRDVTLREDACRVRARHRPQLLATLRNGFIAAYEAAGDWPSLADCVAYLAADPIHALQFIGAL